MSKLIKIAALAQAGFFRAGQFWPHEGVVVDADELDEAVLKRLAGDRNLRIEPAPEGATVVEVAAATDDLKARLRAAIAGLPSDAFGASGAPNLTPLREALPADASQITGTLRDEVWRELSPAKE
ncbi:MAG: hypothetical protein IKG52_11170 [Rhodobacteraceae bacterium]|nr:hypothetical protein [Paracoccaceae bacterium]